MTTTASEFSVYLRGSEAAGCARPDSDIDVVVITDADHATILDDLAAVLEQQLPPGRPLDLMIVTPAHLERSHLLRNALIHGRLIHGEPLTVPQPDPGEWVQEAYNAALLAAVHGEPRIGVHAWLAGAAQVKAGGDIPARRWDALPPEQEDDGR